MIGNPVTPNELLRVCLNEIALEGRDGITLHNLFNMIEVYENDYSLRTYLWKGLRSSKKYINFYCKMDKKIDKIKNNLYKNISCSDMLLNDNYNYFDETNDPELNNEQNQLQNTKKRKRKRKSNSIHSKLKNNNNNNNNNTKDSDNELKNTKYNTNNDSFADFIKNKTLFHKQEIINIEEWSLDKAIDENILIIANECMRFRVLGIKTTAFFDTNSITYFLLERIGRSRIFGETVVHLTKLFTFENSRRLHHHIDRLASLNLVKKQILLLPVAGLQNILRVNVIHLTCFVSDFNPSMYNEKAILESNVLNKKHAAYQIESFMKERNEPSMVFSNIARFLGYNKRQLENYRVYLLQQETKIKKPRLRVFLADCQTDCIRSKGRRLWCVRLTPYAYKYDNDLDENDLKMKSSAPFVELGLLEQAYGFIAASGDIGRSTPEIRERFHIPHVKLAYKVSQKLITNYPIIVEKKIIGKNKVFLLSVPKEIRSKFLRTSLFEPSLDNYLLQKVDDDNNEYSINEGKKDLETIQSMRITEKASIEQNKKSKKSTNKNKNKNKNDTNNRKTSINSSTIEISKTFHNDTTKNSNNNTTDKNPDNNNNNIDTSTSNNNNINNEIYDIVNNIVTDIDTNSEDEKLCTISEINKYNYACTLKENNDIKDTFNIIKNSNTIIDNFNLNIFTPLRKSSRSAQTFEAMSNQNATLDSTSEGRVNFIRSLIQREKIVCVSTVRKAIIVHENKDLLIKSKVNIPNLNDNNNNNNNDNNDNDNDDKIKQDNNYTNLSLQDINACSQMIRANIGSICIRTVYRLLFYLEKNKEIVFCTLDIPYYSASRRVRTGPSKTLKCVALPQYANDEEEVKRYIKFRREEETNRQRVFQDPFIDSSIIIRQRNKNYKKKKNNTKSSVNDNDKLNTENKADETNLNNTNNDINDISKTKKTVENENSLVIHDDRTGESINRIKLTFLQKQCKKFGHLYGLMRRVSKFHIYLWDQVFNSINNINQNNIYLNNDGNYFIDLNTLTDTMPVKLYIQSFGIGIILSSDEENLLEEMIKNNKSVHEMNENELKLKTKIWHDDLRRSSRILLILLELGLLKWHIDNIKYKTKSMNTRLLLKKNDPSLKEVKNLKNKNDKLDDGMDDEYLSRFNKGGGKFELIKNIRIRTVEDNNLKQNNNGVYPDIIPITSLTSHNLALHEYLQLYHIFKSNIDVKNYWEALKYLCIENDPFHNSKLLHSDEKNIKSKLMPRPKAVAGVNICAYKAWVPGAKRQKKSKKLNDTKNDNHDKQINKKKNKKDRDVMLSLSPSILKFGPKYEDDNFDNNGTNDTFNHNDELINDDDMDDDKLFLYPNRNGPDENRKFYIYDHHQSTNTHKTHFWAKEENIFFADALTLDMIRTYETIVPVELQYIEDEKAIRSPCLYRMQVSWTGICAKLNNNIKKFNDNNENKTLLRKKTPRECRLRARFFIDNNPWTKYYLAKNKKDKIIRFNNYFKSQYIHSIDPNNTNNDVIQDINVNDKRKNNQLEILLSTHIKFDGMDEVEKMDDWLSTNIRLKALLSRAILILFQPDHEYFSIVAENSLKPFNVFEIKFIWRYMWFKGWIVRLKESKIKSVKPSKSTKLNHSMNNQDNNTMYDISLEDADNIVSQDGEFVDFYVKSNQSKFLKKDDIYGKKRKFTDINRLKLNRRGYGMTQRIRNILKTNTLSYSVKFFIKSYEVCKEIENNIELDIDLMDENNTSTNITKDKDSNIYNQYEILPDCSPEQVVTELSYSLLGISDFVIKLDDAEFFNFKNNKDFINSITNESNLTEYSLSNHFDQQQYKKLRKGAAGHVYNLTGIAPLKFLNKWKIYSNIHSKLIRKSEKEKRNVESQILTTFPSTEDIIDNAYIHSNEINQKSIDFIRDKIILLLNESDELGIEKKMLQQKIENIIINENKKNTIHDDPIDGNNNKECIIFDIQQYRIILDDLIDENILSCVNGYNEQIIVLKEKADIWLLAPYSIEYRNHLKTTEMKDHKDNNYVNKHECIEDTTNDLSIKRLYNRSLLRPLSLEKEKDINIIYPLNSDKNNEQKCVSYPWLKLNCKDNKGFIISLKRRLLDAIIKIPGISLNALRKRIDRLLCPQDLLDFIYQLMEDNIIYARAVYNENNENSFVDMFTDREPEKDDILVINAMEDIYEIDLKKYHLRLFPYPLCIQYFGRVIRDTLDDSD